MHKQGLRKHPETDGQTERALTVRGERLMRRRRRQSQANARERTKSKFSPQIKTQPEQASRGAKRRERNRLNRDAKQQIRTMRGEGSVKRRRRLWRLRDPAVRTERRRGESNKWRIKSDCDRRNKTRAAQCQLRNGRVRFEPTERAVEQNN